jgi:hypothetical protein
MTESKFKEPWTYFDNGFDGGIKNADGEMIFGGEPFEGRLELTDVVRLVLAAPELYAFAIEVARSSSNSRLQRLARTVVSKAEG